jgi:hypothetical protein
MRKVEQGMGMVEEGMVTEHENELCEKGEREWE